MCLINKGNFTRHPSLQKRGKPGVDRRSYFHCHIPKSHTRSFDNTQPSNLSQLPPSQFPNSFSSSFSMSWIINFRKYFNLFRTCAWVFEDGYRTKTSWSYQSLRQASINSSSLAPHAPYCWGHCSSIPLRVLWDSRCTQRCWGQNPNHFYLFFDILLYLLLVFFFMIIIFLFSLMVKIFFPAWLIDFLQLEGTENSRYLDVLRLFAYGTWTDYKSKLRVFFLSVGFVLLCNWGHADMLWALFFSRGKKFHIMWMALIIGYWHL